MNVIILVAFVVMAWRRKWISDDGYIYLTYVQNLTENGVGPVFNSGERVEAFTSTGWYVFLSVANLLRPDRLLSMRQMTILCSLVVSTGALALWPLVEQRARLTLGRSKQFVALSVPMAAMAGTYVFQSFATSGLETPLQLLWLMAVLVVVWSEYGSTRHMLLLAALGGIGPLIRPDLAIVSASLLALFVYVARRHGAPPQLRIGLLLFALPAVVVTVARVAMYGQLLPNTYYAKTDTGLGFSQGVDYLRDVVVAYHPEWIVVMAIILAVAPFRPGVELDVRSDEQQRRLRASRRRAWLLITAGVHAIYVLSVGGDFMHGRFWITPWTLLLGAIVGLGLRGSDHPQAVRRRMAAGVAVPIAVFVLSGTADSRQRDATPGTIEIIDGIADEAAAYTARNPNLHDWSDDNADPWAQLGRVARDMADELGTEIGLAQVGIGQVTFLGQRDKGNVYIFDQLGLTQQSGARIDAPMINRRIGHAKPAPEILALLNERVDFHSTSFPGYDEAFAVTYRGEEFVLVNLDLIADLRSAGMISDLDVERMHGYLETTLDAERIDRNVLTFLTARYHRDDDIRAKIETFADEAARSQWSLWLDEHAASLQLLDNTGCGVPCFRLAVERHRAPPMLYLVSQPDMISTPR